MILIETNNVDTIIEHVLEAGEMPVFKTIEKYSNMIKERFVVPQNFTAKILEDYVLDIELQKRAVNRLVDRTPNWLDIAEEDRIHEIKAILTLETVAHYLLDSGTIREGSDMYENGFDKDGNVVVDVFYVENTKTLDEIKKAKAKKKNKELGNKILEFKKNK